MAKASLSILTCLHSWYYFKNLAPVFEQLHGLGHRLTIVALNDDREDFRRAVEGFASSHPGVRTGMAPSRGDGWMLLCWSLRQTLGFIHFLDPRFDAMPRLRGRMSKRAADKLQELAQSPRYRRGLHRQLLQWIVRRMEAAIPPDPEISRFISDVEPDVLLLTPLIDLDGGQWDYLKSAKSLGVPTLFPVYSWDNLSSKTHLFELPDRILVWNQRQVEEAIRYHRTPGRLIRATGAQSFDEWFVRRPSLEREAYCRALGLDPRKPVILYVASATTRRDLPEWDFTQRWLSALRSAGDARLRDANVVIRPHPKREHIWTGFQPAHPGNLAVHPRQGQLPIGEEAKRIYFDSLVHCDLVVGLNTSALIEAGIVGRPVFTVLDPAFAVDQTETFHFHYLLDASQGLLSVALDFEEHLAQVARALDDPEQHGERARAFVRHFVRPKGEATAATGEFVREVTALAERRTVPVAPSLLDRLLRRRMAAFVFDDQHLWFQAGKLKKLVLAKTRNSATEPRDVPASTPPT